MNRGPEKVGRMRGEARAASGRREPPQVRVMFQMVYEFPQMWDGRGTGDLHA